MLKLGLVRYLGYCIYAVGMSVLAECGTPAYACPLFVEFFSDPVDVPDPEGEFVEIRLSDPSEEFAFRAESLLVQFEGKAPLRFEFPQGNRLLLVHDSASCPGAGIACGLLGTVSLPNSRESSWLLEAGTCRDSVVLPKPKPGKSLQRVKETDEWVVSEPTPGIPDEYNEWGVVPERESIDSLAPLRITEIHHCPAEPEPEWVEVYNGGATAQPLSKFHFCGRGGVWGALRDSIEPYESVLFSRDTLLLRESIGYRDVRLVQVSMGYLNNTAGSLAICAGEAVVDSVSWDKNTVRCPSGFNPQTLRTENTPGFQGLPKSSRDSLSDFPFEWKLSSRVVRRGGAPLRVFVESEVSVQVRLLDSAGRSEWSRNLPACSNAWWEIPLERLPKVGVAFVELSSGKFEKRIGILLRP